MPARTPTQERIYADGSSRALLSEIDKRIAMSIAYLDDRSQESAADEACEWLVHLRISRGLAAQTIATYAKNIAHFFTWVKDSRITLDQITLQHLEDWQKWMYVARHYGDQFRKQHIAAIRQFFIWRDRFLGKENPAKFMRGPKVTKKTPRKFTTGELQKLFATCDTNKPNGVRDYALLLFLYSTGARKEEAQQINIDDLLIRERTAKIKLHGKGAKEREVSFQGEAVDALRRWLTLRDSMNATDRQAVWIGLRGQTQFGQRMTARALEIMLQKKLRKAGLSARGLHAMRVTFATDLYDEGCDIEVIQQLLGHEKIETTRRYIVVSERKLQAKMPVSRINLVTGRANRELPLWAQKKQPR